MKQLTSIVGTGALVVGAIVMLTDYFVFGLVLMMIGFGIGTIVMFWGFAGKMEVIAKHTGLYGQDEAKAASKETPKSPTQKRRWD